MADSLESLPESLLCPECEHPLEDDFGLVECSECGAQVLVGEESLQESQAAIPAEEPEEVAQEELAQDEIVQEDIIGDNFLNEDYAEESSTEEVIGVEGCLLYTSPSPRDQRGSRMPSSA